MAFCGKCGTQMNDGAKFCPACGAKAEAAAPVAAAADSGAQQGAYEAPRQGSAGYQQAQQGYQGDYRQAQKEYRERAKPEQAGDDMAAGYGAMAILAYSGILFLVPWLAGKESKFAQFHANQGLVLLLLGVAYGIVTGLLTTLFSMISVSFGLIMGSILSFLSIAIGILAIIGMINCCKGRMKPLPIIGGIRLIKG